MAKQQKGSFRKLVVDYLKLNPNKIVSKLQIAEALELTPQQVYDALYSLVKDPTNNIEKVGWMSWRYLPQVEKRQIVLTVLEEDHKGNITAEDKYGSMYLVKPI